MGVQMSDTDTITPLRRSTYVVPGTTEHLLEAAAKSPADAAFLDLEDSVAPDEKIAARETVVTAINELDWRGKTVFVRVNTLSSDWAGDDIDRIVRACPGLDSILLPKAESPADIHRIEKLLDELERDIGRKSKILVDALIETPLGVCNVEAIAASSRRLQAMYFGPVDYSTGMGSLTSGIRSADLGASSTDETTGDNWLLARSRMANACRAFGLLPIDGPHLDTADLTGQRAAAERAARLGFEGVLTIDPSQIPIVNQVFSPTEAEVGWARGVLEALSAEGGAGAAEFDGMFVDLAHIGTAQGILSKAQRIADKEAASARD